MKPIIITLSFFFSLLQGFGQLKWENVDALYQPLPSTVHVYKTTSLLDGKPNIAYYLVADLKDRSLDFVADTSKNRRLTPAQFYQKNNGPVAVVNTTFFSFETNRSLNAVIRDGKLVAFNNPTINGRGKDTFTYRHPLVSAIGIFSNRKPDIAWLYTDSIKKKA